MIDDVAARFHATVHRTPVGEANVAAAIRAHHALLGGEGNGGVIFPPVVHVRDSLAGIALILDMLALREQRLSAIVAEIPRYVIVKEKMDLRPGLAEALAPRLEQAFAGQKIDLRDGVRVDYPDRWVSVRTSNTEPIVRIIAEAPSAQAARELIHAARRAAGIDA